MKLIICALLSGASLEVSAQIYKCPDAQGKPVYSHVSCDPGQRPISMSGSGSISASGNATSAMQLMDSAAKETDSEKRRSLDHSIRMSIAAYKAQALADAIAKSEQTAGVPTLAQQLKEAELRDRADPQWNQYRSDSPITAGIRQQLNSAREQAERRSSNVLATNSEYARVMARFASFESGR